MSDNIKKVTPAMIEALMGRRYPLPGKMIVTSGTPHDGWVYKRFMGAAQAVKTETRVDDVLSPSEFRKARAEFGESDAADAYAYLYHGLAASRVSYENGEITREILPPKDISVGWDMGKDETTAQLSTKDKLYKARAGLTVEKLEKAKALLETQSARAANEILVRDVAAFARILDEHGVWRLDVPPASSQMSLPSGFTVKEDDRVPSHIAVLARDGEWIRAFTLDQRILTAKIVRAINAEIEGL